MADCVRRTLCEHNHMFTDKNCNGCEHKETHWQYIWATRKKGWKAMDNRCVCCGAIIPEGTQVCPTCARKGIEVHKETGQEKFDRIVSDWVAPFLLVGAFVAFVIFVLRGM